jgi:hypothetical protein
MHNSHDRKNLYLKISTVKPEDKYSSHVNNWNIQIMLQGKFSIVFKIEIHSRLLISKTYLCGIQLTISAENFSQSKFFSYVLRVCSFLMQIMRKKV